MTHWLLYACQEKMFSRQIEGLKELNHPGQDSLLFAAERLAYRNGYKSGEREAEKNVMEDDEMPAHQYNSVQEKQQSILAQEAKMNQDEGAALQRTATLESMEHAKLAAWSAKVRAEEKLLAKAQLLRERESSNLKRTAGLEDTYATSLRSRAQELRAAAARRLSRLAAHPTQVPLAHSATPATPLPRNPRPAPGTPPHVFRLPPADPPPPGAACAAHSRHSPRPAPARSKDWLYHLVV